VHDYGARLMSAPGLGDRLDDPEEIDRIIREGIPDPSAVSIASAWPAACCGGRSGEKVTRTATGTDVGWDKASWRAAGPPGGVRRV
jgi:hypothetical protein